MAQKEQQNNKKSVSGKVEKVVFHDPKTGRSILSIEQENGRPCSVIGNTDIPEEGSTIAATGRWRKDEKYGWQFLADDIQVTSQPEECLEPVEDGLMHGLDFSNVLNKKHKEFRNIDLDYEYDEGAYDLECLNEALETIKESQEKKKAEEKKSKHKESAIRKKLETVIRKEPEKKDPNTVTVEGAIYNKEMTRLISGPKNQATFIIPIQVTCIGGGAFSGSKLESVVIPDSVRSIGNGAFSDCRQLTSINIPSSVEHIGDLVFAGCQNLKTINVDKDNKSFCDLDGVLYSRDLSLVLSVPNGLSAVRIHDSATKIKTGAFHGCNKLTELYIPSSVENIGQYEFGSCSKLLLTTSSPKAVADGGKSMRCEKKEQTTFALADSVTHISKKMFRNQSQLLSVVIPSSVESIEEGAFSGCPLLSDITVEEGNKHFRSIDGVLYDYNISRIVWVPREKSSVTIPNTVTKIGDYAFDNCRLLETISIPESVTTIGSGAFQGCSNLVMDIPDTVLKFGADAFSGCKGYNLDRTVDVDLKDVLFLNNRIRVPNPIGGGIEIKDNNVDSTMNSMRKQLAKIVPCLTIHYGSNATLVNAKELHDAVITLKIKNDLTALIREGHQPAEILRHIDGLSIKCIRELTPRDMTPYINFLMDKHAADKYPLVPIEEYIGGRLEDGTYVGGHREEGALYTIMIDGQPNIVWENNKDSRSTYVFSCTEEDYEDTRQLVFDYIMAEGNGKRKLLHTDKCLTIFKEQPRMIVHNNLRSWAAKLLQVNIDEIEVEDAIAVSEKEVTSKMNAISSMLSKEDLRKLSKATIYMEYELDPELHFYDDQMWDDDGAPVELYYTGEKTLSRERTYKVSKRLIAEALSDYEIKNIEEAYELICEHVVGYLGDELDEVSDGVNVSVEIDDLVVYSTNIES